MQADAAADELIHKFSAAVGELVLWANSVDHQLNQALMLSLVLPEHPFVEPIVAQLEPRAKAELLKKRARLITGHDAWREGILRWAKRAEKVQANRNIVAHHQVRFVRDKPVLFSSQLGKIFRFDNPPDDGCAWAACNPSGGREARGCEGDAYSSDSRGAW